MSCLPTSGRTGFGVTDGRTAELNRGRIEVQPTTGDVIVAANGWGGFEAVGGTNWGQMHSSSNHVVARLVT